MPINSMIIMKKVKIWDIDIEEDEKIKNIYQKYSLFLF
jgi:hypothetical protein